MEEQEKLREDFVEANAQHLHWLETFSADRESLYVAGVDVLRSFSYELIQVMNHEYMKERLGA